MPFDPALPAFGSPDYSEEMRRQLAMNYKESQRRRWVSSAAWSRVEMRPTTLRTRRDSTVASWALAYPSLPDVRPRSDRFRCGGRESNFLAAKLD